MAAPPPFYTITFNTNGGYVIPSYDVTCDFQVGKTYSSQGGFPPSSFRITTATGEYFTSYRWGGRNGADWRYGVGGYVYGGDYGDLPGSALHPSPWMCLAGSCFLGWFDAPVGGNRIDPSSVCSLTRDTTLYAQWNFCTVKYKFDARGGVFADGSSAKTIGYDMSYSRSYGRLPVPTRPGYRFQGWFTLPKNYTLDDLCDELGYDSEDIHDPYWTNQEYVDAWEAEPRGGRKVLVTDVYNPRPSENPYGWEPLATNGGDMFWSFDLQHTTRRLVAIRKLGWQWFNYDVPQGDPMTVPVLYAHWTADGAPEVTLNDCGGTGGDGVVAVGAGGALPAVSPPTRNGYTFLGYFRYVDGMGVKYYNADGTAAATWEDSCDGEIFAAWSGGDVRTPLPVSLLAVCRHANGSSYRSLDGSFTAYYGERYGDLPLAPHIDGYVFRYWTASARQYPASPEVAVLPSTVCQINAAHYLIAVMEARTYSIIYETGGIALPSGSATTYAFHPSRGYDLVYASAMNAVAPTGYTFGGWYRTPDYSGSAVVSISRGTFGDLRFFAKWVPRAVTVTLNADGGTVSPTTVSRHYGETYGELPRPARSGYTFAGWQAPGGVAVNAYSIVDVVSGAITLTAQWIAASTPVAWGYVKYKIKLVLDGGAVDASYGELKYVRGYAKALPTAAQVTKSGATFGGWYRTPDFSGDEATYIPSTATGTQTFYARWSNGETPPTSIPFS